MTNITKLAFGPYTEVTFKGAGAFGQVATAQHAEHGLVALKFMWRGTRDGLEEVLKQQTASNLVSEDDKAARERFDLEAAILEQLQEYTQSDALPEDERGLFTPRFFGTDKQTVPGVPILVTEYVQAPFEDVSRITPDNLLGEEDVKWIVIGFLHLVSYIHEHDIQGYKHYLLDAQLQNIRFDRAGKQLRILDWNGVESLEYGKKHRGYDHPASHDIWWSMAFLFQMLTGEELPPRVAQSGAALARRGGQRWQEISEPLRQIMCFLLPVPVGKLPEDITAAWLIERLRNPSLMAAQSRPINEQRMIAVLDSLETGFDSAKIRFQNNVDDEQLSLKYLRRKLLLASAVSNRASIKTEDVLALLDVGTRIGIAAGARGENLQERFPNGEPPGLALPYKLLRLELRIRDRFPDKPFSPETAYNDSEIDALKEIRREFSSSDWSEYSAYRDKLALDLMKQEDLSALGVQDKQPLIKFSNIVDHISNTRDSERNRTANLDALLKQLTAANSPQAIEAVIAAMNAHAQEWPGHNDLVESFKEGLEQLATQGPKLALVAAKRFKRIVEVSLDKPVRERQKEFLTQLSEYERAETLYNKIQEALKDSSPVITTLEQLLSEADSSSLPTLRPLFSEAFADGITSRVEPDEPALESLITFTKQAVTKTRAWGGNAQKHADRIENWCRLAESIRSLSSESKQLEKAPQPSNLNDAAVETTRKLRQDANEIQQRIKIVLERDRDISDKQKGKLEAILKSVEDYAKALISETLLIDYESLRTSHNELASAREWSDKEGKVTSVKEKLDKVANAAKDASVDFDGDTYETALRTAQEQIDKHKKDEDNHKRTRIALAGGIILTAALIFVIGALIIQGVDRAAVAQQTQVALDRTNVIETRTQSAFQNNMTNTARAQLATEGAANAKTGTAVAVANFTKTPTPTPTHTPTSTNTLTPTPTRTPTVTPSTTPTQPPVRFALQSPVFNSTSKTYSTGVIAVASESQVARYRFRLLDGDGSQLDEKIVVPPIREVALKVPADRSLLDQTFTVEVVAEDTGGTELFRQTKPVRWIPTPTPTATPTPIVSGVASADQFTISAPDGKPLPFLVPDLEYGTKREVTIWPADNANAEKVGTEIFRNFLGVAGDSVAISVETTDFIVAEKIEVALYRLKSDGTNSEQIALSPYQSPVAFEVPISGYYNIGIRSAESGKLFVQVIGKNVTMIDFVGKLDNPFNITAQIDASNPVRRYRFFGAENDEIWLGYKLDPQPTRNRSVVLRLTNPNGSEQTYPLNGSELVLPTLTVTGYYTFAVDASAVMQPPAGFGMPAVNLSLKAALLNTEMRFAQTIADADQPAFNLPGVMPIRSSVPAYGFNSSLLREIGSLKATGSGENQFIGSLAANVTLLAYSDEVYQDTGGAFWRLVRDPNTLRLRGWASSKFTNIFSRTTPAAQYSPTPKP